MDRMIKILKIPFPFGSMLFSDNKYFILSKKIELNNCIGINENNKIIGIAYIEEDSLKIKKKDLLLNFTKYMIPLDYINKLYKDINIFYLYKINKAYRLVKDITIKNKNILYNYKIDSNNFLSWKQL